MRSPVASQRKRAGAPPGGFADTSSWVAACAAGTRILRPCKRHSPALLTATSATSCAVWPAPASAWANATRQAPEAISGSRLARCAGVPKRAITSLARRVSAIGPGTRARPNSSRISATSTRPNPAPSSVSGTSSVCRPRPHRPCHSAGSHWPAAARSFRAPHWSARKRRTLSRNRYWSGVKSKFMRASTWAGRAPARR